MAVKPPLSQGFQSAGSKGSGNEPTFLSVWAVRPEDFAIIVFHLVNIRLDPIPLSIKAPVPGLTTPIYHLASTDPGNAYIIMEFPSQSVGEQAFSAQYSNSGGSSITDTFSVPAAARYSGPSWISCKFAPGPAPVLFSLESMLEYVNGASQITQSKMGNPLQPERSVLGDNVPPGIAGHPVFQNQNCDRTLPISTAIEAPYRLYISPLANTVWRHASKPESSVPGPDGAFRTVMWHTTLRHTSPNHIPRARAIWNADYNRPVNTFTSSLSQGDRQTIVQYTTSQRLLVPLEEMSDDTASGILQRAQNIPGLNNMQNMAQKSAPQTQGSGNAQGGILAKQTTIPYAEGIPTIELDRLMLSSLGASLNAHLKIAEINPLPPGFSMRQWDHQMTMGRDFFARIIYEGSLFPFGHKAVLIKITERIPKTNPSNGKTYAILHQRKFIVVREPVKSYATRDFPFTQIKIKTLVTHDLVSPLSIITPSTTDPTTGAFWIICVSEDGASAENFMFHLEGTDNEGNLIEFSAPLIFMDKNITDTGATAVNQVIQAYAKDERNTATDFANVEIAFTPPNQQNGGSGKLKTTAVTFGAATDSSPYRPNMTAAQVFHTVVNMLHGQSPVLTTAWDQSYLQSGTNSGDVFLRILSSSGQQAQQLSFHDNTSGGGLLAPAIPISGFSRVLGPIALPAAQQAAQDIASGYFNPADLFKNFDFNIFGSIKLSDLLGPITFSGLNDPNFQELPTFKGDKNQAVFSWSTKSLVTSAPQSAGSSWIFVNNGSAFGITTTITQPLSPNRQSSTKGVISDFGLALPSASDIASDNTGLQLNFKSLTFESQNGSKPAFHVKLGDIQYSGFLKYLEKIIEALPADLFGGTGLTTNITPQGVGIGLALALPDVGVGVFDLQHIKFKTMFQLSFVGDPPTLEFDFADKSDPFALTVIGIGGGGYFSLLLSTKGIENITLALEFGATVAIDLGVASGSASIMGGLQVTGNRTNGITITAFLSATGELDVLGLISISVNFYLGLSYNSQSGALEGDASVSVSINILFFSKTVSIHMHKSIKGSDPTFAQALTPSVWSEYCDAFADDSL